MYNLLTKRFADIQEKKHSPSRAKASIFDRSAGAAEYRQISTSKVYIYFFSIPIYIFPQKKACRISTSLFYNLL